MSKHNITSKFIYIYVAYITETFLITTRPPFFWNLIASCRDIWIFCIQVLLDVLGHCVDGVQKASVVLTSSRNPRGGLQLPRSLPHMCCVECVSGCSSSPHLQPPPPPALVDKTPTLPTANSNSAPRLHGYAGLLSKIKPLNPLFAVWWSSGDRSTLPCSSCSWMSRD